MSVHLIALFTGFCLDLALGDPQGWRHPVRAMGWWIARAERLLRARFPKTARGEACAGGLLAAGVLAPAALAPAALLWAASRVHPAALWLAESLLCYQMLAAKSLKDESMKVYTFLKSGDLAGARRAVSMIVGRDTDRLTRAGVVRAAVETVAENTSDGVVAPLFYMALGGPVLGFVYKAANTMDSMVGYRDERYLHFGRPAARLDDLLNLIPSRLSALLMILSGFLLGYDGRQAFRIWRRDRRKHESPNAAQTEAACAGALNIRLAGDARYFGKLCEKPFIGGPGRPVECEDIRRANRLMYGTAWCAASLVLAAAALLSLL